MDEELHCLVEQRAYALWEDADRPDGREMEFWLQAEQEIRPLESASDPDPFIAPDDLDQGEFRMREHFSEEIAGKPLSGTEDTP
jgi:hypothetical protein